MTTRTCDIVIPAFNNALVIKRTLAALAAQVIPNGWRVGIIVSDDGSTDDTVAVAQHLPASGYSLKVLQNNHAGSAAARNRGVAASHAEVILLLGADMVLAAGAVAAHLRFHDVHPRAQDAALGIVQWDPKLPPSPLMEWLMHGGPQNDYDALLGQSTAAPAHFFYGSHISIKRQCLAAQPFLETFTAYGWEDLEAGRRLEQTGLTLYVLHHARAWHAHYYNTSDVARRQWASGYSLVSYQSLYPTVSLIPAPHGILGVVRRRLLASGPVAIGLLIAVRLIEHQRTMPFLFHVFTASWLWRGVFTGRKVLKGRFTGLFAS